MLRRESLFTQGKKPGDLSGRRLIITFFQSCSVCGNIIFDAAVAERQVTCEKNNIKMEETFEIRKSILNAFILDSL